MTREYLARGTASLRPIRGRTPTDAALQLSDLCIQPSPSQSPSMPITLALA